MRWILGILFFLGGGVILPLTAQIFIVAEGSIHFKSDAPLELIEATADKIQGVIDSRKQSFAFRVDMRSFSGFNSALQQTHFNENYLETGEYPFATFAGKIIEPMDFTKDGVHEIRAKGKLIVHGIEQERIIKSAIQIRGDQLVIQSLFTILLDEHNITIPRIVNQKISEEIEVIVKAQLEKADS